MVQFKKKNEKQFRPLLLHYIPILIHIPPCLKVVCPEPDRAPGEGPGEDGVHGEPLREGDGAEVLVKDVLPNAQKIL